MDTFINDFGDTVTTAGQRSISTTQRSLFSSMIQVGELAGSIVAASIGNRRARRDGLVLSCVFVCIGSATQSCSTNSAVFIVGRTLLGVGIGIISNVVPLYLSEVPPKYLRGAMVGT